MAAQRTHFWPRLALFLLVGVGAAIVWGCVATFIVGGMSGQNLYDGRVAESVAVLSDGEPLITSSAYRLTGVEGLPDQTLDRRPVERGDRATVPVVRFNRIWLDLDQVETTHGYVVRVLGVGDNRVEPTADPGTARWYAVRDGSKEGRGYLIGYDVLSKLPLGYIGRNGFSPSRPETADQFVFGDLHRRAVTIAISPHEDSPPVALAYLLDGDRLVAVDTLERTVRDVAEAPDALIMDVGIRTWMADGNQDNGRFESEGSERMLVVWQGDKVSTVDPKSGDVRPYRLPDEVRDAESFGIHLVGPDSVVVELYPKKFSYNTARLLWTTADGAVTREETVTLSGYQRPSERTEAIQATAIVPVPLLLGSIVALGAPQSPANQGKSLGEAVADTVAATWPPFVALLVVCAALAWRVWTVHRRDRRPYAALWAAMVFLLGPAAWFAYVAERKRSAAANCPACGARSPRNRVDCAACGEDAFRPQMLGTEVFA